MSLACVGGSSAANGSIALVMEVRDRELVVVAESGAGRDQATCPLPA